MKQTRQQSDSARYNELVAKFRQAYPPNTSIFSHFISHIKIMAGHLVNSLNTFSKYFKTQTEKASSSNKLQEEKINQEQNGSYLKRKGMILNFNDFEYDDNLQEEKEVIKLKNESLKKPVRSFSFKMEEIQDISKEEDKDQDKNKNKEQDWDQLFLKRIGKKKIKLNPVYENDQQLIETLIKQPSLVTKHFNEIFNQSALDQVEILLEARQIRKKQEANKSPSESIEQRHQNYLKSIGIDNQKDGTKGSYKRLCEMMKQRRERVQKKPPRKRVHVEKDAPPIYSVEKVLHVLQMQKQQFFKEKRQKLQQELRVKRESERLQALERQRQRQAQQQKSFKQRKQMQQRIRKENQQIQNQQKILQAPLNKAQSQQNRSKVSSELKVIPQNQELLISRNQFTNGDRERQIPLLQDNKLENLPFKNPIQPFLSPKKQKQQPKEILSTPPKKVPQETQKQNAQLENNNQQNISNIKQNPFKKNTSPLKFEDLMKKNPVSIFPQFTPMQPAMPTIGSTFFSPNQQAPNIFNPMPMESANISQPQPSFSQNFNSPTIFLANPIQKTLPLQPPIQLPQQPQFQFSVTPPNSLQNNFGSSNNPSNINSSYSNASMFSQQNNDLAVQSGPATINRPFSSFLGSNPEAARMFDRNLFAANQQPETMSLFGPTSQSNNKQTTSRGGGRKTKNQIRIN